MRRLIYIFFFLSFWTFSQPKSAFNDLKPRIDSTGSYSFWVSGHFYGGSSNTSGYPVNTLLGNIDMLNASKASMLISLGDLFKDVRNDIPFYEKSLFNRLELPLYNAVGNHDLSGDVYQKNFGETFYYFQIEQDLHLILDTEIEDGDIEDEQLEMLKRVVDKSKNGMVENIFVYAHRTIWKDAYDELENLFEDNTQSMMGNNYKNEVLPLVQEMSQNAKVWWFAGSLGNAPFSFLHFNPEKNITYIATAIRGLPRDAMLKVTSNSGKVSFETVSLTGQDLEALEYYSVEKWETTSPKEPFNWRLLPLYIKQTVLSWSFFFGALFMLVTVLLIRWIIKRRSRTKPLS